MQIKFNDKTIVSNISAIFELFEELWIPGILAKTDQ